MHRIVPLHISGINSMCRIVPLHILGINSMRRIVPIPISGINPMRRIVPLHISGINPMRRIVPLHISGINPMRRKKKNRLAVSFLFRKMPFLTHKKTPPCVDFNLSRRCLIIYVSTVLLFDFYFEAEFVELFVVNHAWSVYHHVTP